MPSAAASPASVDGVGDREPVDPRHRLDRLAAVDAVGDEHRVDEVGRIQARLAHEAAQGAGGAQPAQAGLRKSHCLRGYAVARARNPGTLADMADLQKRGGYTPRRDA